VNPIIDARIEKAYSAAALAKQLGLSKQYLSKAEQGTYSSLNPSLIRWVGRALQISEEDVAKRYAQFQDAKRRSTIENVEPHKLTRTDGNNLPGCLLFEQWRAGYWPSVFAFSQAFCVHPEMVRKYEEGITPEMPKQIRDILTDANLMDEDWEEKMPKFERGSRTTTLQRQI
jgi:transcriptional regulator with XRE-family HTH domain